MSEQAVKRYWPEEIVGTGELVVYLADYATLEAERDALHAEAEALRAENGRLREEHDKAWRHAGVNAENVAALTGQLESARGLLRRASAILGSQGFRAWDSLATEIDAFLTATPSPEVQSEPPILQGEEFADEFAAWWESDGQFVRAGGGEYERSFAFEAWRHLMPKLRASLAEQGERQEAFAYGSPKPGVPPILAETWKALPEQQWAYPLQLYKTPQPGPDVRGLVSADDVRDACANAVSVFAEVTNADQCREVAEYMREVLLAQIARRATSGKERKE